MTSKNLLVELFVEELPPKPFINLLNKIGLPTRIQDENGDRAVEF